MEIDITSMFFNSSIEGQTATSAWGTAVSKQNAPCLIYENDDVRNIINGMLFCSKSDKDNFVLEKMSSNRELVLFSVFDKVYVNDKKVEGSFILLLVKEHSKSHEGRCILSYPPYAKYKNETENVIVDNEQTMNKMAAALDCTPQGCWFVYRLTITQQDTLCFYSYVVNANSPKNYSKEIKSRQRSEEWKSFIQDKLRDASETLPDINSLQQIFYGAPGTGKSHKIKKYLENNKISKDNIFRTTFHPDSDYSTFVGAYKPTMKQQYRYESNIKVKYPDIDELANAKKDDPIIDNVITYQFIPQTFLQAYIRAYQTTDNVYLVIEEINRGNCAQIFGDLFQLLDRDDNGKSEYHIKADTDLCEFLKKKLGEDSEGIKDGELCLPPNLYIWATMNTSDQSLFPIDSAFKRRWDWEYMPISYNNNLEIQIGDNKYSWTICQKKINDKIYKIDSSEDKKLGDFFVNPHNGIITTDLLLNKILFYLWNDVCKDDPSEIFKIKTPQSEDDITFSGFFCPEKDVKLQELMAFLEVNPLNNDQQEAPETQTDEPIEDSNSNS